MTTEAGKRLLDNGSYHAMECWMSGVIEPCDCGLAAAIAAIEAEARAAERARLRERVEALDTPAYAAGVSRAAVLALLEPTDDRP